MHSSSNALFWVIYFLSLSLILSFKFQVDWVWVHNAIVFYENTSWWVLGENRCYANEMQNKAYKISMAMVMILA